MKIIDLLNKIANGEEVPKKFKLEGNSRVFTYNNYEKWFDDINDKYYCKNTIELCELNDEVVILEEEKKIPEKLPKSVTDNACSSKDERLIANTLNEIIDYLKSKGDE